MAIADTARNFRRAVRERAAAITVDHAEEDLRDLVAKYGEDVVRQAAIRLGRRWV